MFLSVGEAKTELKEFVLDMKQTKLMLKQDASLKAIEFLQQQTTVESSAAFYGLAKLYELPSLAESAFSYMERCFAMVAETPNFLQLDHRALLKVLASSNLRVDSETEVHDAAVAWLSSRSSGERSERALRLLLKVRLPLLSPPTLKYLSRKASPFTENKDCVSVLEEVSGGMQTFYPKKPTVRCCSQNAFDLLLFGGYDSGCKKEVASVRRIRGRTLRGAEDLPAMAKVREESQAVFLNGDVYFFGGKRGFWQSLTVIEKYSIATGAWEEVGEMPDDRYCFCACSYTSRVFLFSGCVDDLEPISSNLEFHAENCSWKKVERMQQARMEAACAVFEGDIFF